MAIFNLLHGGYAFYEQTVDELPIALLLLNPTPSLPLHLALTD